MSSAVVLKRYSSFASKEHLRRVEEKCEKMEVMIQRLLKGEQGNQDVLLQVEEGKISDCLSYQNQNYQEQTDRQSSKDCHIIDITLGIQFVLIPLSILVNQ